MNNSVDTFHIPNPEDTSSETKSEWDTLAEEYSDDDFMSYTQEIAKRNTFDNFEGPSEKSEEEKTYERKERGILDELDAISEKRAGYIYDIGNEYSDILKNFNNPREKRVSEDMGKLTDISRKAGHKTLEALVAVVNSRYPSPFKTEKDSLPNPFEDNKADHRKIEDAEDEYLRTALEQGGATADTLENLSKAFMIDGNQSDFYVGNNIKTLGNGLADVEKAFANAFIHYLDEPSDETRQRLRRVEGDRENLTTNNLFNIASTFDEDRTRLGNKLFEPTVALATQLIRNDEDYFDGIMEYVKFKMDNSKNKPESRNTSYDEAVAAFDAPKTPENAETDSLKALPGDVLI